MNEKKAEQKILEFVAKSKPEDWEYKGYKDYAETWVHVKNSLNIAYKTGAGLHDGNKRVIIWFGNKLIKSSDNSLSDLINKLANNLKEKQKEVEEKQKEIARKKELDEMIKFASSL